jgi:hypothetical protein
MRQTIVFLTTFLLGVTLFAQGNYTKKGNSANASQEKIEWIAEQNVLHAGSAVNANDLPNFEVIEPNNLRDIVNGTITATVDGYPSEGAWTLGVYADLDEDGVDELYFACLNDDCSNYGWQLFSTSYETQTLSLGFDSDAVYTVGTTDTFGDGGTTVTVTGDDGSVWVTAASTSGDTWDDFSVPTGGPEPCTSTEVTFNLIDSYGDGWNGNNLLFGDDAMTVSTSEASFTYCLEDGNYTYTYDAAGSWQSENSWSVTLEDGTVLSAGDGSTDPADYTFTVGTPPAPQANLFFSEYAEGTSSNKYLEIYNGSNASVNLADYVIMGNYNGNPFSEAFTFAAGAMLAAGDVYVVASSDASDGIQALADELLGYADPWYTTSFNGDDVRALAHVSGADTTILDIIGTLDGDGDGVEGEGSEDDPGGGFDVAGTSAATKDYTLVRKNGVTSGNGGDWAASAGTDADNSEWIVADKPSADYTPPTLGAHIMGVVFSGEFGGAIDEGNTYTIPIGTEPWAGFANEDTGLYPFSFPDGGEITFAGAIANEDPEAAVWFRFEYNPYPDTEPSFETVAVQISGTEATGYSVEIPPQGANTFSSFLLYLNMGASVTLSNVTVSGNDPPPTYTANFAIDMNYTGYPDASYSSVVINGSWNDFGAWGLELTDADGDGIFTGSLGGLVDGVVEYVVAVTGEADGYSGWGVVFNAPLDSDCDYVPGDEYGNYGFTVAGADVEMAHCALSCEVTCVEPCQNTPVSVNMYDSWGDGWNGNVLTIGTESFTIEAGDYAFAELCLEDGLYSVTCDGGSFQGEVSWAILGADGVPLLEGGAPYEGVLQIGETTDVLGCMDPDAVNYNPEATVSDGSCYYLGDSCNVALDGGTINGDPIVSSTTEAYDVDWYSFVVDTDYENVSVSLCGSEFDTQLEVWAACDDAEYLGYNDDAACGAFNSQVDLTDVAAGTYYAKVLGYSVNFGNYTLSITGWQDPTGPSELVAYAGVESVTLNWVGANPETGRSASSRGNNDFGRTLEQINEEMLTKTTLLKGSETSETHIFGVVSPDYISNSRSTDVIIECDGGSWQEEVSWEILDAAGSVVASGGAPSGELTASLDNGVYTVNGFDSYGDGWNGNVLTVTGAADGAPWLSFTLTEGDFATTEFTMSDTPPELANLNISDLHYDAGTDAIMVTINNTGGTTAYGFYVAVYGTNPTSGECENDLYDGLDMAEYLNPGTSFTYTILEPASYYLGYGSFDIGMFIDWGCTVDETDETDNTISINFEIQDPFEAVTWNVYRSDAGADFVSVGDGVDAMSFVDESVTGEVEYCYYVTQVNTPGASESTESNTACATPITAVYLPPPTDLAGEYANWEVMLSWTAPDLSGLGLSSTNTNNNAVTAEKIDNPADYPIYNKSDYPDRSRQGGDTVDDATMIESLPYSNTGTTVGYTDDYDEACPYTGSTSPDVVYSYTATENGTMDISLCGEGTSYDTKVYVYENTAGTLAQTADGFDACNDDDCSNSTTNYLSFLGGVYMTAGNTYYIVVDGYGGGAGEYEISITVPSPLLGYTVYRDGEAVGNAPGDAVSFTDYVGEELVGTHSYSVTATYAVYGESEPSNTVDVEVMFVLSPPTNLVAEAVGTTVFLSWDPAGGGGGPGGPCDGSFLVLGSDPEVGDCYEDGTGYFWFSWDGGCIATMIYFSGAPDGMDISSYGFVDGFYFYGFDPGTEDTFVMDFDDGTSSQPQTAMVDCIGGRNADSDTEPILSLVRATSNNSRDMTGYNVYRNEGLVQSVDMETTSFEDSGLEYNTPYEYYVTAVYDEGESGPTNTVSVTLENTPPTAFNLISPADNAVISITPDNVTTGEAMFMWTPSADADGDVVEYTFEWVQPEAWYGDDSVTTSNSLIMPYSYVYEQITSHGDTEGTWWWLVQASDGVDTTVSTPEYMNITWDISAMLSIDEFGIPEEFALHQNYPNPFNPVTTIAFDVPEQSDVLVEIYSVTGQRVKTLVNQNIDAGFHKIMWNGTNDAGVGLASGMYIYKISANNFTNVKKLIFMK